MPGLILPGEETVSVEEPDPPADNTTLDGLRDGTGPEGETVAVRERLPARPLMLVREMVELEEVPARPDTTLGLADIEKSTMWTVTWTE